MQLIPLYVHLTSNNQAHIERLMLNIYVILEHTFFSNTACYKQRQIRMSFEGCAQLECFKHLEQQHLTVGRILRATSFVEGDTWSIGISGEIESISAGFWVTSRTTCWSTLVANAPVGVFYPNVYGYTRVQTIERFHCRQIHIQMEHSRRPTHISTVKYRVQTLQSIQEQTLPENVVDLLETVI